MDIEALNNLWDLRWPGMSKIPYEFRSDVDRWVRFHTLPGSKRYPATDDEYAIVLDRHNAVLAELGSVNGSVLLVTAGYTEHSKPAGDVRSDKTIAVHPGAFHWTSILLDPDPEPGWWIHLYISEVSWSRGALDGVLRLVADDHIGEVTIADPDLRWLYHPYDGGMDVILPSPTERDTLRDRHSDWLSAHPRGL